MTDEDSVNAQIALTSDYRRNKDRISQDLGLGSVRSPISNSLHGIDPIGEPAQLPMNKEIHGITFFTKPRLNLHIDNIKYDRVMYELATADRNSFRNYIRCNLDPKMTAEPSCQTPLVDPYQAFIPLLTNTLESITNWPDLVPETFTSAEGLKKESMSWIDGVSKDYTTYDIQASFRNTIGDPVTDLFFYWVHYMSLVMESRLVPYGTFMINNERDYDTAIYRLTLDDTKQYVRRITRTIAYPENAPIGSANNYEREKPYNQSNEQIGITFRAHGMETQDPILVHEFNESTYLTNPSLRDMKGTYFFKVPPYLMRLVKNRVYPQIDPVTRELEWYVTEESITQVMPMDQWLSIVASGRNQRL